MDFGPKSGGFNVLNVPDEVLENLSRKEFWEQVNEPFLDAAILRGDNILMATRPGFDVYGKRGANVLTNKDVMTKKMELSAFGEEYLKLRREGLFYNSGPMVKK